MGATSFKQVNNLGIFLFVSSFTYPCSSTCKICILKINSHIRQKNMWIFLHLFLCFNKLYTLYFQQGSWDNVPAVLHFSLCKQSKIWHIVIFGYYYGESWIWKYCGGELNLATTLQELALLWGIFLVQFHFLYMLPTCCVSLSWHNYIEICWWLLL